MGPDFGKNVMYETVFPAIQENIELPCRQIAELMSVRHLHKQHFGVQLLLRETINNAIVHGSNSDRNRQIRLIFQISKEVIEWTVIDEGPGFDWRAVLERRVDDQASSGRGLAIMKKYADGFTFNEQGNALSLKVNIEQKGGNDDTNNKGE